MELPLLRQYAEKFLDTQNNHNEEESYETRFERARLVLQDFTAFVEKQEEIRKTVEFLKSEGYEVRGFQP